MNREMFFMGTLFILILYSFVFSQKITNLPPDTLPPANLLVENTPQFIFIGSDDNSWSPGGMASYMNLLDPLKNPVGIGQKETYDGESIRMSFYSNTAEQGSGWYDLHKRAADNGYEIGLHTASHPFLGSNAISEFSSNLATLTSTKTDVNCKYIWNQEAFKLDEICDTTIINITERSKITGVRAPYLYTSDYVFDALDELGLRYDCSVEEGMQTSITSPNGFVYPYTADGGATPGWLYLSDTLKAISKPLQSHPGKWQIPAYPLFYIPDSLRSQYGVSANYDKNKGAHLSQNGGRGEISVSSDGKKVSGLDYDAFNVQNWTTHELAMTLLYNLDLRLDGNRVPLTFCVHSQSASQTTPALKEFIDIVLAGEKYKDVRFVTGNQLIDWMENPIGLDGTTGAKDTCEIFERPKCCPEDEPIYDTICGLPNIFKYKNKNWECPDVICETLIKRTKLLLNKGFFISVVGKSLNIAVENGKTADISVFDMRGRIIFQKSNIKSNTCIPFPDKNGVYFVKAIVGKNTITQKILVK